MSTITATAVKTITVDTFVEAAANEEVKFHTLRANGTARRIRVLTPEEREVAEWVMEQREEGVTMKALAATMNLSVPSVRRLINRYLLTEEVLEADTDEAAEWVEVLDANRPVEGPTKEDGTF